MKEAREIIPACIQCQTKKYVVRDRTAEKIGTLSGGFIGAGIACASAHSEGVVGAAISTGAGVLTAMLFGFLTGSACGNIIGERVDSRIRIQYRCRCCGTVIQG